jgi:hypothetical protein
VPAAARRFAALPAAFLLAAFWTVTGCGPRPAEAPAPAAATAAAADFRERVLALVAEEFPGVEFEKSEADPAILRRDDAELNLTNLRLKCAEMTPGPDLGPCRAVVRQHFAAILESLASPSVPTAASWEDASRRVRPQLAPESYREKLRVAHEPFAAGLIVAYVLDSEKNYSYVTEADRERWGVPPAELRERAIANLESASLDIPVAASDPPDRVLVVELGDGYDATRLLLPGFRRFAGTLLGPSYVAAIPNRDALVLWATDGSPEFQRRVRAQVDEAYRTAPYPLTARLFRVDGEGVRPLPE